MIRRRADLGHDPVDWELSTLAGDAAVQRAVEKAVNREGEDKEEMGRDGFAARARQLEQDSENDLLKLFESLGVNPDMTRWGTESDEAWRAARIAFVRLYDAGVLRTTDAVVDSCPSCESVVAEADTDVADTEVEEVRISLPLTEGSLEINLTQPELLVGAVAVAVPASHESIDSVVALPLVENDVPVVRVEDLEEPRIVVPGHDVWSYELVRQLDLPMVEVLDGEGVVRHPGPLEGLGRYAARSAAIEQLTAEGFLKARITQVRPLKRCYRCATALVPMFGRHWLLSFRPLVDAAVEAIKGGAVASSPANVLEHLLTLAEQAGDWVVSQQLWSGHPIPVATCLDCGQTQVGFDEGETCKSCMGTLSPHTDILDARFVAAITPLAMAGWPNNTESIDDVATTLLVGKSGLDIWALPIAALGMRLVGRIPFEQLVVHQTAVGMPEPGQQVINDFIGTVERTGSRVIRAALLLGDTDFDRAHELVDLLDNPPQGKDRLQHLAERYDKALLAMDASEALLILANTAREGIHPDARDQWRVLVQPLLA